MLNDYALNFTFSVVKFDKKRWNNILLIKVDTIDINYIQLFYMN